MSNAQFMSNAKFKVRIYFRRQAGEPINRQPVDTHATSEQLQLLINRHADYNVDYLLIKMIDCPPEFSKRVVHWDEESGFINVYGFDFLELF